MKKGETMSWGVFIAGFFTAFWGAFELAVQSGSHPVWSGTWGYPFVHHYIVGFMLMIPSVYLLTFKYRSNEK